ncbi:MAG TPA: hypothetical protein VGI95_14230 [Caulobacteraceae bacterium]|jgi:hypothetical protein
MQKFDAQQCPGVFGQLAQLAHIASTTPPGDAIGADASSRANMLLIVCLMMANQADLESAPRMITRFLSFLNNDISAADLQHNLDSILALVGIEMERREFFVLDKRDGGHFENDDLFGLQVFASFPSARFDVREAGSCFALERYSASVHHSMAALEPTLRLLAEDVGAAIGNGMWKGVIDRIESKIEGLKLSLPAGDARNARLQFLSQAAKEFFYFKDGWRNYIAHAKTQYDREQALSAMNHVGSFMQTLAPHLQE